MGSWCLKLEPDSQHFDQELVTIHNHDCDEIAATIMAFKLLKVNHVNIWHREQVRNGQCRTFTAPYVGLKNIPIFPTVLCPATTVTLRGWNEYFLVQLTFGFHTKFV